MNTGDIIKKLRKEHKLTQEDLGAIIGVQKSAIAKYENGRVENLKRSTIEKLANYFNVSPSYILGIQEGVDVDLPTPEVTRTINIYEPLSCGSGLFVDDNLVTTMSIPESMLPKGKKVLFGQYASGDSMVNKGINDGDLLIFSKEECVSGDVGCFCIDENMATCKTLRIVGQQIMLMPANEKYEPIVVDPINFKCVGKLVLVINKRWDEN